MKWWESFNWWLYELIGGDYLWRRWLRARWSYLMWESRKARARARWLMWRDRIGPWLMWFPLVWLTQYLHGSPRKKGGRRG